MSNTDFDIIILGAGHAGCEAALASARLGCRTLCLTMNLDSVALMACNPAIGGTSKGHLVREIDALGGEMGLAADDCFIQMRMLNTGKGVAVHSLRAQMDKRRYHERMKLTLENNVTLRQGECTRVHTRNGKVCGITCKDGSKFSCRAVVVACGVYLKSRILIGEYAEKSGPSGLLGSYGLSKALIDKGFVLRRFKTGTPPRIDGRTVNFDEMTVQNGDVPTPYFSFMSDKNVIASRTQYPCYLTYTNEITHKIIRDNIHRSSMFNGMVNATGTRYCPSIEDKLVRFADKDRHQVFIEPEGLTTNEYYVQGMSTSLPVDVQNDMIHSIKGLESCNITRYGYAIEYDCIDPTELNSTLGAKHIDGMYFAGQINGSSGYEEAAAQGIIAGINAAQFIKGEQPFTLSRADAYIGVLVDDLSVKGTNEPYRMMTSRAEYRLILRQDNADLRLTEYAHKIGLADDTRYDRLMQKREKMDILRRALNKYISPSEELNALLSAKNTGEAHTGVKLYDLLKRNGITYTDLLTICADLPECDDTEVTEQIKTEAMYEGYIAKQEAQIREFLALEEMKIPDGIDYNSMHGLRLEARQKLSAMRPDSLGKASRISGVSPADIAVLTVKLRAME